MSENAGMSTPFDLIDRKSAAKAIEEILNAMHPAPSKTALGELFTPQAARELLDRIAPFSLLLDVSDSHAQVLERIDAAIAELEQVRDEVLNAVYQQIRPLERSYKQIQLFLENAEIRDNVQRPPIDLFVFNADARAITSGLESTTTSALAAFVQSRNDGVIFRQFVCTMVVPGCVPDAVRTRLEDMSSRWGTLLIGDLEDETSLRALSERVRMAHEPYEFLKRPERAGTSTVIVMGYVKLREKHWFEEPDDGIDDADLYSPASMLFAGLLARADRATAGRVAQGPVGVMFGTIRGVERARIEPRISQMEQLAFARQVVFIIRNEDKELCVVGGRSESGDPKRVLTLFTSGRVLHYLERQIATSLEGVAKEALTIELVQSLVRDPIEAFLNGEKQQGTLNDFTLDIDLAEHKLAGGLLDIALEVRPVGPEETFSLQIVTPKFLPVPPR